MEMDEYKQLKGHIYRKDYLGHIVEPQSYLKQRTPERSETGEDISNLEFFL